MGKEEGKGQLSVSTLLRAGKGAVEGCYGQAEGRGKAGREKNRDVRGEEDAKRRHKALGTEALGLGTQWFPVCKTHAYPWQMLKQDSPSFERLKAPTQWILSSYSFDDLINSGPWPRTSTSDPSLFFQTNAAETSVFGEDFTVPHFWGIPLILHHS